MNPENASRRNFLSAGLAAGLSAGLPLPAAFARTSAEPRKPSPEFLADTGSSAPLRYRILGRTGLKVTTLGFGCGFTLDPSVIERAADIGINFFDTARGYLHGNSERMVGAALGVKRKQVVLATKTGARDKETMLKDLDTSLRELNTDYVDIWFMHGEESPATVHDDRIEAQQIAKKQGKTRFTGISTHTGQQQLIPFMVQKGVFDVVLTGYNFTMGTTLDPTIDIAVKAGMGVVGMKAMAGGPRALKPGSPVVRKLAQEGAMLAALKWVVQKPAIATCIPSMMDMDQLEENMKAMAEPFAPADEQLLAQHLDRIRPLYCRMCGQCAGACQKGLPVADVLRYLTYADGYGQFSEGREKFLALSVENRSVRCGDCADCTVQCPHGVRVSDRMARAQEVFA
jgi:predicted aldo/keto reductase-like oxidoreductase